MITKGSCLCEGVRYSVTGPLRNVLQCHCTRCQKFTGNFMAASGAFERAITIDSADTLTWFSPRDDANVAYAFCSRCGSSLFWRVIDQADEDAHWSICAGTLDDAPDLVTEAIWFSDHAAPHTHLDVSVTWLSSAMLDGAADRDDRDEGLDPSTH